MGKVEDRRTITLTRDVGAWVDAQAYEVLTHALDALLDEYLISDPPPQDELPPKGDRVVVRYRINDDLYEQYRLWAAKHELQARVVLRGAFGELYQCREDG